MRKYESVMIFILILILSTSFNLFGNNDKQNVDSKDLKKNQQKIIKPEQKPKNEKREKLEISQDIAIYKSAIDAYKSAIDTYRNQTDFYERILWLVFALFGAFGVIIWRSYAGLRKRTSESIKDSEAKIEEKTRQITTTGSITIGILLFNIGRKQDAIPYLEGSLINKKDLAIEWQITINIFLGNIYCDFNNIAKATEHSDEAFKLNQNLALVIILKSKILQLKKDYASALKEIEYAEKLAISENYPLDALPHIYIFHGELLIQAKKYKEAKELLEREKEKIQKMRLSIPLESPQQSVYNSMIEKAEDGIKNLEMREFLKDKFGTEPTQEEVTNLFPGMKYALYANRIEMLYKIFEDSVFLQLLNKIFEEKLSRPPQVWEILSFGDKWLAKEQVKKDINEIIIEEVEKYPEFGLKKESEEKYDRLINK